MWLAIIILIKRKEKCFFLLLCLKTLLGITAKATCFLCSRDPFAWANPQRQFKLEPFFLSLRVKAPPWQRDTHSPELSSQQLCRGKLVKASALSCKGRSLPALSAVHSVCWQRMFFNRQEHELWYSIVYWALHYRNPFYLYDLGIHHVASEEVGDFAL